MTTKVGEVMTSDPITVGGDAAFEEIVATLLDNDISAVPVVDDGCLVGVVSEADLLSRSAYGHRRRRPLQLIAEYLAGGDPQWLRKAAGDTARDLMTASATTVSPTDDAAWAAQRMLAGKLKQLIVVEGERRVVGIVTRQDLLRALNDSAEATPTKG